MSKSKLEYIWLDGYKPTQNMRSKTKVIEDFSGDLKDCPVWSFDGSSTKQAVGDSSDCLLKPVAVYPDPARENGFLVMTEVLNADGTPHESNGRALIDDNDNDFWFGFEQEYFIMDTQTQLPLGFQLVDILDHKVCTTVQLAAETHMDVILLKSMQTYVFPQD
jgi:glutamine synthetase